MILKTDKLFSIKAELVINNFKTMTLQQIPITCPASLVRRIYIRPVSPIQKKTIIVKNYLFIENLFLMI